MNDLTFAVLALGVLAFGLFSKRFQRGILTPPIAFVALGLLLSDLGLGLGPLTEGHEALHLLAELTLVVILFTDAVRIDLNLLRREHDLPVRLLAVGMPLTILAGTGVAVLLFPSWSIWVAALLAAVLAPTDAALGQAVVSSPKVPVRIRQTLNVESGLNDGIALPVVLIFFSIACATNEVHTVSYWVRFIILQLTMGPLVGALCGYGGGKLLDLARDRGWMSKVFQDLSTLSLALLAFSVAGLLGGNGFIAAFCAGLTLGNVSAAGDEVEEFAEAEGQLLSLLIFCAFGALMVPEALRHLSWQTVLYAILSLTVIRMLPVALALLGKGLKPATVGFLGWFGPRGIASILFTLLVLEGLDQNNHGEVVTVVMLTVLLSVVAHGVSASPLAAWYAGVAEAGGDKPEMMEELRKVTEMPLRLGRHSD
jgi:NhaP-type Na+/H+ or K+/H+ antiporter